ncbi:hypothetical protein ACHAXA_010334 [Cyclostephanos tholiformis]|uniref:S-adenosylmethionine-dependent methyltransferase domain-containing protein n=1 Tax=Cyclostephanos tholiformis TaxID=382380 RepID=A0ABD3RT87_9STRA
MERIEIPAPSHPTKPRQDVDAAQITNATTTTTTTTTNMNRRRRRPSSIAIMAMSMTMTMIIIRRPVVVSSASPFLGCTAFLLPHSPPTAATRSRVPDTAGSPTSVDRMGGRTDNGGGVGSSHIAITAIRASSRSPPRRTTTKSSPEEAGGGDVGGGGGGGRGKEGKTRSSKDGNGRYKTIADMMKALERDPNKFVTRDSNGREVSVNGRRIDPRKGPSKRTRAKVDRPKQSYVYASQRRAMNANANTAIVDATKRTMTTAAVAAATVTGGGGGRFRRRDDGDDNDHVNDDRRDPIGATAGAALVPTSTDAASGSKRRRGISEAERERHANRIEYARSLGLDPNSQRADAIMGDGIEDVPRIVGRVRVGPRGSTTMAEEDDSVVETSGTYAYVIYKPPGWCVLGEKGRGGKTKKDSTTTDATIATVMTSTSTSTSVSTRRGNNNKTRRIKAYDEEVDDYTYVEYDEDDVLALLTPKERLELAKEGGLDLRDEKAVMARDSLMGIEWDDDDDGGVGVVRKKRRNGGIVSVDDIDSDDVTTARIAGVDGTRARANLNVPSSSRPSLASWLKDLKAAEGTPVRGGKYWIAIAGATDVDDSGLVLLCPRDRASYVHVDTCSYVAVIGNGGTMASRSSLVKSIRNAASAGGGSLVGTSDGTSATFEVLSRMRTGRAEDPVTTVRVCLSDGASTCDRAVLFCQDELGDGVRGDAAGDPLDRRSWRRLVHCESMTVSSLVDVDIDEPALVVEGVSLPDDISNYSNRRDGSVFVGGSFLGRRNGLSKNGMTNAYREINGAADGYPGWIVDRYDKWLYVQQEEEGEDDSGRPSAMLGKGPLPSLHDGYTAGVYYLPIRSDRSIMGNGRRKPVLLEGKAAPEIVPVVENGINYLVNLGDSFSTGIFLDQRLQRAYLANICNRETRVLNCFAHAGAFSVAAATSGARTVSLDLDRKWLDRIRPQMEANGIVEWEGRHDVIYGDCFDWLARLAKRNEPFDVVILDPPSTSVGKKKKRWSVKSDMAELVTLAVPLVKSDGLLFTTTNSASLRIEKFVNMCKKGLTDAGVPNARLERVSPMPSDFSSMGSQADRWHTEPEPKVSSNKATNPS